MPLKRVSCKNSNKQSVNKYNNLSKEQKYKQHYLYHQKLKTEKVKKRHSIIRRLISFIVFLFIAIFICPYCYENISKPIFFSHNRNKAVKVDYEAYLNKTIGYLSNNYFIDRPSLVGANIKKPYMKEMYLGNEIASLKNSIKNLALKYPQLKPHIFIYDYQNSNFVDINANEISPVASIIKIPILIELFKSIEANQVSLENKLYLTDYFRAEGSGSLQYKQAAYYNFDYLARVMITESDNSATNMLMSAIGGKVDINRALRLWGLKKSYVTNWLPDLEGENISTAKEIAIMLYNIDNSSFLSMNSREKIIDYMSNVKNNRLLASVLDENSLIIHKTGDIGEMLGDAGIIYLPNGRRYIIVTLVKRPHNSFAAKEFIIETSKLVYNYMSSL